MKKLFLTTGLMFVSVSNVQATEITKTNATGTTFKFTATLDSPLTAGNKVKIDFGKGGLKAMSCSATVCTLSSNALPSGVNSATYKIGIYNSKNVLQGAMSNGTYIITSNSSAPVSNYTKIANDGSELPDSVKLGTNPKDWACTKDNKTGLIWEVKTTDGGLHDFNKTFTNYTPDYPKCDWTGCDLNIQSKYGKSSNSDRFLTTVNQESLCGATDWRIPTNEELKGLIYCKDNKYNNSVESNAVFICKSNEDGGNTVTPTINTAYFPNIQKNNWFWTSSPGIEGANEAWSVNFSNGYYYGYDYRDGSYNVRLVRNSQ